jgi:hypothetical protein
LFCGGKECHKKINYKAAIYGGVRTPIYNYVQASKSIFKIIEDEKGTILCISKASNSR